MNTKAKVSQVSDSASALTRRAFFRQSVAVSGVFMAGSALMLPAAAQTGSDGDPFAGDARLLVRGPVRAIGMPVAFLLTELERQSGVRLSAEGEISEERITVLVRERACAETLRALASFLEAEWTGNGGGYVLRRKPELEEKQRTILEARLRDGAARLLEDATLQDREGMAQGQPLTDYERVACKLLRTQSEEQIVTMMRRGVTVFTWPETAGNEKLPFALIEEVRAQTSSTPRADDTTIHNADFVWAQFSADLYGMPRLRPYVYIARLRPSEELRERLLLGGGHEGPLLYAPQEKDNQNQQPIAPSGWEADPALTRPVSLTITPPKPNPSNQEPLRLPVLGEALDNLYQQGAPDILADAFFSNRIINIRLPQARLGDALTQLVHQFGYRWGKQSDLLFVVHRNRTEERLAEPPAASVARWTERLQRGTATLDDYAAIASLSEPKLNRLAQIVSFEELPWQFDRVHSLRHHMLLWAALTEPQKKEAQAKGTPYSQMTPAQQKLFLHNLSNPISGAVLAFFPLDQMQTEILPQCRLRLTTQEVPIWRVRGERGFVQGGPYRTKEEALLYFQASNKERTVADIQAGTNRLIQFSYETDTHKIAHNIDIALPPKWKD